jgi:hypothetical protein
VGAAQMLAGMPEFILFTWLIVAGLWLIDGPGWSTFGRLAMIIALISGLAAAQLLPFWQFLSESKRDVLFRGATWELPLWGWANFFVPLFHSRPSPQGVYFPIQQPLLTSYYISLPAVVMAVWGCLKARPPRVWFLVAIALLGIWLSLGAKGYLYGGLLELFPALTFMRYPVKFLALTLIAVPLLAAFGVAHWTRAASTGCARDSRMILALGGLCAVTVVAIAVWGHSSPFSGEDGSAIWRNALGRTVWLACGVAGFLIIKRLANNHRRQLGWSIALLAVMLIDSLTHVPRLHPTASANVYTSGVLATRVDKPPSPERSRAVMGTDKFLFFNMLPDPFQDLMGRRASLLCNLNLLDHVASLDGFYAMYLPAQREAWTRMYTANPNEFPDGLADFMALSHITSPTNVMAWIVRTNAMTLISAGQKPEFIPAASSLPRLLDKSFNPRTTVYLPEEAKPHVNVTNQTEARILAERVKSHEIEADIEAAAPSLVVVSQSDYRPWRAFVDGHQTPVWRANFAFQAVQVPTGRHTVRLVYKDRWFERGCVISLASLATCLFGVMRGRKGK